MTTPTLKVLVDWEADGDFDPHIKDALTFPGSDNTDAGTHVNRLSPVFVDVVPGSTIIVHVTTTPNAGSNVGVFCTGSAENHYTDPSPPPGDYEWVITDPGTGVFVYSYRDGAYHGDLTGAGTYDYVSSGDNPKDVTADLMSNSGVIWERGRSADFSADATGAATFVLKNTDGTYSPDANPDLLPSRPVLITSTYSATERAHFYGFIQRVTPDAWAKTVTITCYDPLRRMSETDVVIAANAMTFRSARDFRREILEDFERGDRNLIVNPAFASNVTGWTAENSTLTRITTDAPPGAGTTSADYAYVGAGCRLWQTIKLSPILFAGQVYRFSVYIKVAAGTLGATIGIGEDVGISVFTSKDITATTTWTRHTITYALPTTRSAISAQAIRPFVLLAGAGTLRVGNLSFTRGQALYPYSDTGAGRWPNWCGNGSFDGGGFDGWYDGWTNLSTNPSFETNTTGWTNVTRVNTSTPKFGSWHGSAADLSTMVYSFTGTFKAGVRYYLTVYLKVASGSGTIGLIFGSIGTPADRATGGLVGISTGYQQFSIAWTPSADRTDAMFTTTNQPAAGFVDGLSAVRTPESPSVYSDTGPGGGGSFVTSWTTSTTAKYGNRSQRADTPATATAGRFYDFNHAGGVFVSGQPYTASVWLRPTSDMPYKVGFGANAGDGTWDEASVTGTATADVWTQVTVTWTPSADRSSITPFNAVLYVYQTDATARTFRFDGVRVIPGSSADDFEMAQWTLGAEDDIYPRPSPGLSGSALAALTTLNGLTLTRHYIRPSLTSPFYAYVSSSRDDLAAKTSAETFDNDFSGFTEADIDRDAIVNIVPVIYSEGTEYYSDEASVGDYGPRPAAAIGSSEFFVGLTNPDLIGPALVTRYKDPRSRPTMDVRNRFTSQLVRELDDLVTVDLDRLAIAGKEYLIVKVKTTVTADGKVWTTTYGLEEHAF